MRVVVLHNAVSENALPEDRDTLVQVEAVEAALRRLGHEPSRMACTLDLAAMREGLLRSRPEIVFNLVESLADADALAYLPSAVLDVLGIPYTGSRAESLLLTSQKILAKQQMQQAGLPTPPWIASPFHLLPPSYSSWILKGVWDQGSRDLDDEAVLRDVGPDEVVEHLRRRAARTGRPCFAERFIDGREFVVSMLADGDGPEVHPPVEIEFIDYPPGQPRIVGYRAKWRDDCAEYHRTPRRFEFDPADRPLLEQLRSLAGRCWTLFGLRGWARVDFRVDGSGQPWILEVNANPCLSPEAGFAATLERTSTPFEEAIRRILDDTT